MKLRDLVGVSFRRLRGSWILISASGKRQGLMAQDEKGTLSTVGKIRLECIVPVPFAPDGELLLTLQFKCCPPTGLSRAG